MTSVCFLEPAGNGVTHNNNPNTKRAVVSACNVGKMQVALLLCLNILQVLNTVSVQRGVAKQSGQEGCE